MPNNNSRQYEIKPSDYLKTLERSIDVIKAFEGKESLTITESTMETGFSKPFTRRVFITLQELGYMESKNSRFSLTPKMIALGNSYSQSQYIWDQMVPFLEELSSKIKESTSIAILDGIDIVYVERVTVNNIMKESLGKSSRLPAHASSVGKLLLAHLPEHHLNEYFGQAILTPFTKKTITSETKLREELSQIKGKDWAINIDELELGLISMAAPIRDIEGKVRASVNCVTHSGRCSYEEALNNYLPELQKTAEKITSKINIEII